MDFKTPVLETLDQDIRSLVTPATYPSTQIDHEVFQPRKLRLSNKASLIHYNHELECVDYIIEYLCHQAEEIGLRIDKDFFYGKASRPLCPDPGIQSRNYRQPGSPAAILERPGYQRELSLLTQYLDHLQAVMPAYPAIAQIQQIAEALRSFKHKCHTELIGLNKGDSGEKLVLTTLNQLNYKYIIRDSVVLKNELDNSSNTSETDAYVITPKGVFVIEIKNQGSEHAPELITTDGRWQKLDSRGQVKYTYGEEIIDPDGRTRRTISPLAQNQMHAANTERFLMEYGMYGVPMFPVVVYANYTTPIENKSIFPVINVGVINSYIDALKAPDVLSHEQMEHIAQLFDEHQVEPPTFEVLEISSTDQTIRCYIDAALDSFSRQRRIETSFKPVLEKAASALLQEGSARIAEEEFQQIRRAAAERAQAEKAEQARKAEQAKKTEQLRQAAINEKILDPKAIPPKAKRWIMFIGKTILRIVLSVPTFWLVWETLDELKWFKKLLCHTGYLQQEIKSFTTVSSETIALAILCAIFVATILIVWLFPHMIHQCVKKRNAGYVIDALSHCTLAVGIYFLMLFFVGLGWAHAAMIGYAILMIFSILIWFGKFLLPNPLR